MAEKKGKSWWEAGLDAISNVGKTAVDSWTYYSQAKQKDEVYIDVENKKFEQEIKNLNFVRNLTLFTAGSIIAIIVLKSFKVIK